MDYGYSRMYDVQLGIGAAGAEDPVVEFSGRIYYESLSGFTHVGTMLAFSIPRKVPANSRVAVRVCDELTIGLDYDFKLQYIELPAV